MNPFKADHSFVVIIFFILISLSFSSVYATEYYAFRLSGSDCLLCHADPKTGSLNQIGTSFQEEGYRYPYTWKETFFYFLLGLTLFLIIFGFDRRFRLWHLGRVMVSILTSHVVMRARRAWQSRFSLDYFVAQLLAMTNYLLRLY
jgi:hypothetical protein